MKKAGNVQKRKNKITHGLSPSMVTVHQSAPFYSIIRMKIWLDFCYHYFKKKMGAKAQSYNERHLQTKMQDFLMSVIY